jgi:hypothetical protein
MLFSSTMFIQLLASVLPAVIIAIIAIFFRRSLHDLHHGLLGLLLAFALTIMVTEVVKVCIIRISNRQYHVGKDKKKYT